MNNPVVLITGVPGWLGTRLLEVLTHGLPDVVEFAKPDSDLEIRCLVLPGEDLSRLGTIADNVAMIPGDVTKAASLEAFFDNAKGATLYHCAGIIHPNRGIKQFYEVNVSGTQNILSAAAEAGIGRMIHVSSNSPIGTNPSPEHLFDESEPYHPYMNYGKSKMEAEELVNDIYRRGDLDTVIIRPPWFYGPWQPDRQTLFFSMIKNGKMPIVGNGENRRSMAYVDNICQGLLLCDKVETASGQTYWIADRQPYTMNEIVDTIQRLLEKDFSIATVNKRLHLPSLASEFAWLVDKTLQGIGLYHQKIHVLSEMNKTIACSIGKAEKEIGYKPVIDLEEGMRRSIRWILDRGMEI